MTADRARSALAHLLLVEAIVAFTFSDLLEPNRIPLVRDTLFFFVPYKQHLAERIARGEPPLRNPYVYSPDPVGNTPESGRQTVAAALPLEPS